MEIFRTVIVFVTNIYAVASVMNICRNIISNANTKKIMIYDVICCAIKWIKNTFPQNDAD